MPRRALCWVRRDLRLSDHAALAHATSIAEEVVVAFVFDTTILDLLEDRDDKRVTFIHHSIQEMDEGLRQARSAMLVRHGDPVEEIPKIAQSLGCEVVVTARDYEPAAIRRDETVSARLQDLGITFETVKDNVVFEPGEIKTPDGGSYRVYTPYSKMWRSKFSASVDAAEHVPDLKRLASASIIEPHIAPWTMDDLGFQGSSLWLAAGETGGKARLEAFQAKMHRYAEGRDFPGEENTSGLSVHFRFGTMSIRSAVRAALELDTKGADKWLAELIWREFYVDILGNHPNVVQTTFNPLYADLEYPGKDEHWDAWAEGKTGYPIVDAAMRCLNATGWMHNRLRMVVASFLTKDLLLDYRRGEAYFARKLLDFELASNNGGWQWAASVGADPQPYFRIFNPILQSKKFDPQGKFIREWLPELAELTDEEIHWPLDVTSFRRLEAGVQMGETYPWPIVDHGEQRERAIALLSQARDRVPTG